MFPLKQLLPFILLFFWPFASSAESVAAGSSLPLADLVREVDVALLRVADTAETQHLPQLQKAVLEVNTSMKRDVNGKISLWVVELGGAGNNEYASKVIFTLKPPPPGSPSNIGAVQLANALTDSILAGAHAIMAAETGNPPLLADDLVVSVRFAIAREGNGKLAVKFPPFEASFGGGATSAEIQSITVTYKG